LGLKFSLFLSPLQLQF